MKRRTAIGLVIGGGGLLALGKMLNVDRDVGKAVENFFSPELRELYAIDTEPDATKDYLIVKKDGKLFSGFELRNMRYTAGETYIGKLLREYESPLNVGEETILAKYMETLNKGFPVKDSICSTIVRRLDEKELSDIVKKYKQQIRHIGAVKR